MTTKMADVTLMAGNSGYANENFAQAVPFGRIEELFNVEAKFEQVYTMRDGEPQVVPGRHALVREDDGSVLNVVSHRYAIHQFGEVLIDNLLTLMEATGDELEVMGAGLLQNGAVGWIQVRADEWTLNDDTMSPTITLASSHNGTLATSYRAGLHRFICSNQLSTMSSNAGSVYKLRHTVNSRLRFDDAAVALGMMSQASQDAYAETGRLMSQEVTDREFAAIVEQLDPRPIGDDVSAHAVTRWENRREAISNLYRNDERVAEFTGTGWGVVQAFNTYRQWERPYRKNTAHGEISRFGRAMTDYLSGDLEAADARVIDVVSSFA